MAEGGSNPKDNPADNNEGDEGEQRRGQTVHKNQEEDGNVADAIPAAQPQRWEVDEDTDDIVDVKPFLSSDSSENEKSAPPASTSQKIKTASRSTQTAEGDPLEKIEQKIVEEIHTCTRAVPVEREDQIQEQQAQAQGPANANPPQLSRAVEAENKHILRLSRSTTRIPLSMGSPSFGEALPAAPTPPSTTAGLSSTGVDEEAQSASTVKKKELLVKIPRIDEQQSSSSADEID